MKLICRQIINQLLGIGINVSRTDDSRRENVLRARCQHNILTTSALSDVLCPPQYDKLSKLTQSSRIHFDSDELKAMVAALHFIFLNSAKYDVGVADGVAAARSAA
jgi:hypothetical protein